MGLQKEGLIVLKHIPNCCYDEVPYRDAFDDYVDSFLEYYERSDKTNVNRSIMGCISYEFDGDFNECGMDKLVILLAGMLFEMEHNDVDSDFAYNTWLAIQDFKTGEFDDLFTPDDLVLIKEDIAKIDAYFDVHPEQAPNAVRNSRLNSAGMTRK